MSLWNFSSLSGIEPRSSAVKMQSCYHWIARDFPPSLLIIKGFHIILPQPLQFTIALSWALSLPPQIYLFLFGCYRSQLQHTGSLVVVCGIQFPDQGSNPGPLHQELGVSAIWTTREVPFPGLFLWLCDPYLWPGLLYVRLTLISFFGLGILLCTLWPSTLHHLMLAFIHIPHFQVRLLSPQIHLFIVYAA